MATAAFPDHDLVLVCVPVIDQFHPERFGLVFDEKCGIVGRHLVLETLDRIPYWKHLVSGVVDRPTIGRRE
jgi:hypothetical protein